MIPHSNEHYLKRHLLSFPIVGFFRMHVGEKHGKPILSLHSNLSAIHHGH